MLDTNIPRAVSRTGPGMRLRTESTAGSKRIPRLMVRRSTRSYYCS